jgi:hypothetical protein
MVNRQLDFGWLVFVRAYVRVRYGKQEHVCSHYRSWPSY